MIHIKTQEEIAAMREGGRILADVLSTLIEQVRPGISELDLDNLAEKLIIKQGAQPGFKRVKGYRNTICVSTNDVVVHGIPTSYVFKEGDVVGIDCGVFFKGFNTDMAETTQIKDSISQNQIKIQDEDKTDKFLRTGMQALQAGINAAKLGNKIGDISKAIQTIVEGQGYSIVRSLIGHGVGRELHEDPEVPGFLDKPIHKTPMLKEGMTIAIEVIYNMGKSDVVYSGKDDWTIKSRDNSLSGLFERTVAITKEGTIVLTQR